MTKVRKSDFKGSFPLIISLIVTFGYVLILENSILNKTGGVFAYPLDDPFIHMQVAKNLAFNHTWGIFSGEFASASSSLLYTVVLALLFKIFSVHVTIPVFVNVVAAFFLLMMLHRWLQKQQIAATGRTLILLAISFFTPLPILIISGMEHTLQCLFSFLFLTSFTEWLAYTENEETKEKNKLPWQIFVYAFLVVAIRYEGIFLVGIACCVMLFHRRILAAFQLGGFALLPVIIFGIVSVSLGSYFLPNSVLVKSASAPLSLKGLIDFVQNILIYKLTVVDQRSMSIESPPQGVSLLTTQRLLIMLPVMYFLFVRQFRENKTYVYIFLILLLSTLLHLSFAATGWFYRYEAYLIFCSLSFLFVIVARFGKQFILENTRLSLILTTILLFAIGFPFVMRSMAAYTKAKQACYNIYEQQYQMARFIQSAYSGKTVAANDIGAISFLSSSPVIDLWGLGNIEVARSKKERRWTPAFLDSLVRREDVKVAVIYNEWFNKKVFENWTKVGSWQIFNNVICGGEVVTFYAIENKDSVELKKNLLDFQPKLPADVKVVYYE